MIGNFLVYLLEVSIGFALIYGLYIYALYKTTYFVWSRWYLLFAILISIIIPLLPFPYSLPNNYISNNLLLINTYTGYGITKFKQPSNFAYNIFSNYHFNLPNILFAIYISGFIRSLIISVKSYTKISHTIKISDIEDFKSFKLVNINNSSLVYSWFKYIFLSTNNPNLSNRDTLNIIEHEKIHVAQHHSLDILLYEIYGMFFWFNPLVKKSKQTIKNIHEFIVDSIMLKTIDAKEYSNLLIKLSGNESSSTLVNHFARNPILDRVWLMVFPNHEKLSKIRFISGMPLMIVGLLLYSFIITEINKATNSLQINKEYDFVMPVKGNYKIISPFFIKKQLKNSNFKNGSYKVLVSHPEISISTESNSKIIASRGGIVKDIKIKDNWGVKEISIEIYHTAEFTSVYKGLKRSMVILNDTVVQSQVIGETGDSRLYTSIGFQLLKNNEPVNPVEWINK